jgi:hypothetical protein
MYGIQWVSMSTNHSYQGHIRIFQILLLPIRNGVLWTKTPVIVIKSLLIGSGLVSQSTIWIMSPRAIGIIYGDCHPNIWLRWGFRTGRRWRLTYHPLDLNLLDWDLLDRWLFDSRMLIRTVFIPELWGSSYSRESTSHTWTFWSTENWFCYEFAC